MAMTFDQFMRNLIPMTLGFCMCAFMVAGTAVGIIMLWRMFNGHD